ncbi:hypothetical protein ACOMHN_016684 [Nucella lapillus]
MYVTFNEFDEETIQGMGACGEEEGKWQSRKNQKLATVPALQDCWVLRNHIAGLLFRVEHAVKTGATRSTSTEKQCTWNVPSGRVAPKPGRVRDGFVAKDTFTQKVPKERKQIVSREKRSSHSCLTSQLFTVTQGTS